MLGLTLAAERPNWRVTLADISSDALTLARENADALGVPAVSFIKSDLFSALGDTCYHGIVANLPYVPETDRPSLSAEVLHDPDTALFAGADGLDLIRNFIPNVFHHLHPGGWLVLEIGHDQASQVAGFLRNSGFDQIEVQADLSGIPRFPYCIRPTSDSKS